MLSEGLVDHVEGVGVVGLLRRWRSVHDWVVGNGRRRSWLVTLLAVPTLAIGILRWWWVEPSHLLLPLVLTILVAVDATPDAKVTESNEASDDGKPKHPSREASPAILTPIVIVVVVLVLA